MNKLIALDMDGTILTDDHLQPHPKTIEALKAARDAGWKLAIATGRPLIDAKRPFISDLCVFDYYLCNNGTYYWEPVNDEFTFGKTISKEIVKYVAALAIENKAFFALHTKSGVYRVQTDESIDVNSPEFEEMKKFKHYKMEDVLSKNEVATQVSIRTTKAKAKQIINAFDKYEDKVTASIANEVYVDFNPKNVSKFSGLENIAYDLDIEMENVVAFGDSGNDIDMIKNVGYGIAMGNATQEAKDVAKEVIGDNNSDAIYQKIMELIK